MLYGLLRPGWGARNDGEENIRMTGERKMTGKRIEWQERLNGEGKKGTTEKGKWEKGNENTGGKSPPGKDWIHFENKTRAYLS